MSASGHPVAPAGRVVGCAVVKYERRAAFLALLVPRPSLKDRMFPVLNALRAYEISSIRRLHSILMRVDKVAGLRLNKLILRKLGIHGVRRSQFTLREGNLRLQKIACDLRVSYLRVKLVEGGYDFRVSAALRSADQSLKLGAQVGNLPEAISKGAGPLYRGLKAFWREVQLIISAQSVLEEFAKAAGQDASGSSQPQRATSRKRGVA